MGQYVVIDNNFASVKDNRYKRAKIIDIGDSANLSVFCIDDGTVADVNLGQIISYPIFDNIPNPNKISEQMELPECTFPCQLYGIVPSTTSSDSNGRFSNHAENAFNKALLGVKEIIVEIHPSFTRQSNAIVPVDIHAQGPNKRIISDELVQQELAKKVIDVPSTSWYNISTREKWIVGENSLGEIRNVVTLPYAITNEKKVVFKNQTILLSKYCYRFFQKGQICQ